MSADRQHALRYSSISVRNVEGWLVKEGRNLRARRSRYVRLRGAVLSSHRTKNSPPSWEIAVTNASVSRGPAHEWHILLDLPSKHISFVANDKKQFEQWIYALRRASLFSSRVEDYYRIRHIVGEGMNGKVRLGNDLITDETVAIKTVPRLGRTNEDQFLAREVEIMLSMDHPNIVKTFDIFVRRKRIHFVMEYVPGGELFDLVAANTIFTEARAASVMHDLLSAIAYLHKHNIAHRDVKLENLLCMRNTWPLQVKLADFGFANHIKSESDKMLSSFVGTPYYIAPEMLLSKGHGRPVDIWACGVVMYILLSGKFPFGGETEKEYYSRVLSREVYFPTAEWKGISAEAKSLVSGMLTKDPSKRLAADDCLRHPWLSGLKQESAATVVHAKSEPQAMSPVSSTESAHDSERSTRSPMFRRNRSRGRSRLANVNSTSAVPRSNGTLRRRKRDTERKYESAKAPSRRDTESGRRAVADGPPSSGSRRKLKPSSSHPDVTPTPPSDRNLLRANPLPGRSTVEPMSPPPLSSRSRQRPTSLRQSGTLPAGARRQSLIRRLLSTRRVSMDHVENRYQSLNEPEVDADDEASAVPRKTISLFGKLAPIRRSFHRARGANDDGVGAGINFVNSQNIPGSSRLPPKVAREQMRAQAARSRKASRRGLFRFRFGSQNTTTSANSLTTSEVFTNSRSGTEGGIPDTPEVPTSTGVSPSPGSSITPVLGDAASAALELTRQNGKRVLSDSSAARIMGDRAGSELGPFSAQWPDSRVGSSLSRRVGRLDVPRMQHSTSEPPNRAFVAEVNNTPLSQQHMNLVMGLASPDDGGSSCSLALSSASSLSYAWGAQCTTPKKRSGMVSVPSSKPPKDKM